MSILIKKATVIITGILIILFALGYCRINRQFPRAEVQMTSMNNQTEYFDDVYITVNSAKFLTKDESKSYQQKFIDEPFYEKRHIEIIIKIENKSNLEKEAHLYNLNLETPNGYHASAAFVEFEKEDSNEFLVHHLLPGEKRTIKLIFPILLYLFPQDGQHVEEECFYLTYDLYPIKRTLELNME